MTTTTSEMMLPILLVGLTALFLGGLIGAVIVSVARSNRDKPHQSSAKNLTPLLQVWRERRNGRLVIGVDDETFLSVSGLSSRQRAAFQHTLSELQEWQENPPARPSQMFPPPVMSQPEPTIPAENTADRAHVAPAAAPTTIHPSDFALKAALPQPPAARKPEPPPSIVAQIDEILQEALPHTILKNRKIRLVEKPGQGMQVVLDGRAYEGVGDVPDPTVRLLIQKCVNRWEQMG